jgi:hypothetical protein
MKTSLIWAKTRKEVEVAKAQAANDERTASLARQTARAAKVKLKQTRKLAKLAKKAARKAEDRAEISTEALESAQSRLEKLEKRLRKERKKQKPRTAQSARPAKRAVQKTSKPRSSGGGRGVSGFRSSSKKIKAPVRSRPPREAPAPSDKPALPSTPSEVSAETAVMHPAPTEIIQQVFPQTSADKSGPAI